MHLIASHTESGLAAGRGPVSGCSWRSAWMVYAMRVRATPVACHVAGGTGGTRHAAAGTLTPLFFPPFSYYLLLRHDDDGPSSIFHLSSIVALPIHIHRCYWEESSTARVILVEIIHYGPWRSPCHNHNDRYGCIWKNGRCVVTATSSYTAVATITFICRRHPQPRLFVCILP